MDNVFNCLVPGCPFSGTLTQLSGHKNAHTSDKRPRVEGGDGVAVKGVLALDRMRRTSLL